MNPPKWGVSNNIGKNFSETLQFEDLAVKHFFLFIMCIFLFEKNCELVSNAIFRNVERKEKKWCKKSHNVFKGLKESPLEHT